MIKKGSIALIGAALFLLSAIQASACDSSCPISHRKGHLAPWEALVEKSFGIPTGFGRALMTEDEWAEQKVLMAGMQTKQREEHKKKMNSVLTRRAAEKGITVPAIGNKRAPYMVEKARPIDYGRINGNTADRR